MNGAKDCCLISLMVGLGGVVLNTGLGGGTGSVEKGFAASVGLTGLPENRKKQYLNVLPTLQ